MQWFKFYGGEYLSDPKILSLSPCERSCWVSLLSYACVAEKDGRILHLSEDQLMRQAGVDPTQEEWEQTEGVLQKFVKLGMITHDNEVITLLNWQKRQQTSLTGYERVKRYREKKRHDNSDNANDNARVEENRIEENINIEKFSIKNKLTMKGLNEHIKSKTTKV